MSTPMLVLLVGLPGCGKTTWAKTQVALSEGKIKRVAKEDIRAMLDNGRYFDTQWQVVESLRDSLISTLVYQGFSVIVDETNLPQGNIERLINKYQHDTDIYVVNMMNVPIEDCVRRDSLRSDQTRRVGEQNIRAYRNMYDIQQDFWKQFPEAEMTRYKPVPKDIPDVVYDTFGDPITL